MSLYDGDSFFTLSALQQVGLLAVTLVLSGAVLAIVARASRPLPVFVGMLLGCLIFYIFVWLSPQAYYAYYLQIFDSLPLQWVVGLPPGPELPLRLLSFTSDQNLSAHGQGLLGWLLILAPLFIRWRQAVGRDE